MSTSLEQSMDVLNLDKFDEDYQRFLAKLGDNRYENLTEEIALKNLMSIDARQINLQVVGFDQYSWLFIPIFKRKTFCFPSPLEINSNGDVVSVKFDKYDISNFTDYCYWFGTKGESRCNHKSCQGIYYCFKKAAMNNMFYRALWLSFEKQLPKSIASQILSLTKANCDIDIVKQEGYNCLLVPYKGMIYYNQTDEITGYNLLLNKGDNVFEFLNKKVVPHSFEISNKAYPPNYFSGYIDIKGDVHIKSNCNLSNDTRITQSFFKRHISYSLNIQQFSDYCLFSFDILSFKNSLFLARNETEKFVQNIISLLGGLPLFSDHRSQKSEEEKNPDYMGRKFLFFAHNTFLETTDIVNIYKESMHKLSLLDVEFSKISLDSVRLPESIHLCVNSNFIDNQEDKSDSEKMMLPVLPFMLENGVKTTRHIPHDPDINVYAVIKPSGNSLDMINTVFKTFVDNNLCIENVKSFVMNNFTFNALYPNCLNRVYGKDWHTYMTSGECLIVKFKNTTWQMVRSAALEARKASNLPWVKNVIHTAASFIESELMHDLFGSFFVKQSDLAMDFDTPARKIVKIY